MYHLVGVFSRCVLRTLLYSSFLTWEHKTSYRLEMLCLLTHETVSFIKRILLHALRHVTALLREQLETKRALCEPEALIIMSFN